MSIFKLPDLGEGLTEAEFNKWYVKAGDSVSIDQPLCAVETAKALVDIPSPFIGKITKVHFASGDIIPTGATLVEYEDSSNASEKNNTESNTVVGKLEKGNHVWQQAIAKPQTTTAKIKATPAVRALATKLNVALDKVLPTGAGGSITAADVTAAANNTPGVDYEPLHGPRRAMAQAMVKSHQSVVPVTLVDDIVLHNYSDSFDITVNLILSIVHASDIEPSLNAWFDGNNLSKHTWNEINLGIACDTEDGLFVPVINNVGKKDAIEIRSELNNIKTKVEKRSILPEDMQNASMTLSNFGRFGGKHATPIVVPPQVTIIASGAVYESVTCDSGNINACWKLPISLTFDHRAATGGEAARFMSLIVSHMSYLS